MPELDFSIPASKKTEGMGKLGKLLVVVGVVELALLVVIACAVCGRGGGKLSAAAGYDVEKGRDAAQHLERLGLYQASARAWEEYLDKSGVSGEERARVLYRLATIQQNGGDYEQAVLNFLRSESAMKLTDLEDEITRRTNECLRASGKAVGLTRNIEARTSVGTGTEQPGDEVLAEIGAWKITRNDLEQRMEKTLELQMGMTSGAQMDDEQKQRKEMMLKQMFTDENRQRFLQELLLSELLSRECRATKLNETAEVRDQVFEAERLILAGAMMRDRLKGLEVTESELKNFYAGNQARFTTPAGVRLAHVQCATEAEAQAVQAELKAGRDFAEVAKARSADKDSAGQGGALDWLDAKQASGWKATLVNVVGEQAAGTLVGAPVKTDKGWHVVKVLERRAESVRPYDDNIRKECRQLAMQEKNVEIQNNFYRELCEKYNVVMPHARAK